VSTTPRTGRRRSAHHRGYDHAFAALVHPLAAELGSDQRLGAVRGTCDTAAFPIVPQTAQQVHDSLRALRFLRDLDALDQQHVAGTLSDAAYARLLQARHTTEPIESWMVAVGLAELVDRLMTHRRTRHGDPTYGR